MLFEGCWQRIERARAHRHAIFQIWTEFSSKQPNTLIGQVYGSNGEGHFIAVIPYPLPSILSLELGEMLYQLRAALDGSIYASNVLECGQDPPPDDDRLEFPIFDRQTQWDELKNPKRNKLGILGNKRKTFIESVQPYKTPVSMPDEIRVNDAGRILGILNNWARMDRHRRLHVVNLYATSGHIELDPPEGLEVISIEPFTETGVVKKGEILLGRFVISGLSEIPKDFELPYEAGLTITIGVDEAPLAKLTDFDTFSYRISHMIEVVEYIVRRLENVCVS